MTAGATIDPARAVLGLTPQQWAFCEAYVANGGNGTQAAITAGYGASSAHVRASKLLRLDKIQSSVESAVTAREEAVAEEEGLEAMRERIRGQIIQALCNMGFTRMDDLASWTENGVEFIPSAELTPEALEAIEEIESQVNEGESQDGKTLYRNARLKVKRAARLPVLKELTRLLELGPKPSPRGKDARDAQAGPAVLVVVAGGMTGLELGAQVAIASVSQVRCPPGGELAAPAAESPPASAGATWHPSSSGELRPWNPRPRKAPLPGAPAPAVHVHAPEARPALVMPNVPQPIDPKAVYLPVDPPRGHDAAARFNAWRQALARQIRECLDAGHDVVLDCSQAGYIDTARSACCSGCLEKGGRLPTV
jgi:hypothetical protein